MGDVTWWANVIVTAIVASLPSILLVIGYHTLESKKHDRAQQDRLAEECHRIKVETAAHLAGVASLRLARRHEINNFEHHIKKIADLRKRTFGVSPDSRAAAIEKHEKRIEAGEERLLTIVGYLRDGSYQLRLLQAEFQLRSPNTLHTRSLQWMIEILLYEKYDNTLAKMWLPLKTGDVADEEFLLTQIRDCSRTFVVDPPNPPVQVYR